MSDEIKQAKLNEFRMKNADISGTIKYITTLLIRENISFTNEYAIRNRLRNWRIASSHLFGSHFFSKDEDEMMTAVSKINSGIIELHDLMRMKQKQKRTKEE